jgi:hypothetical protein
MNILVTQTCFDNFFCEVLGDMIGSILAFTGLIDSSNGCEESQ